MKLKGLKKLAFTELLQAAADPPPEIHFNRSGNGPWLQLLSPHGMVWKTAKLPIRHLPVALDGLRLLHLSDIHMRGYWGRGHDELVEHVQACPPDLIVITGDFAHSKVDPRPALPYLRRLLKALPSRLGTFGILGNHDSDHLRHHLADMGVILITGRRAVVSGGIEATRQEGHLELIGLPGVWRSDYDSEFVTGLPRRDPGMPRIVLCHFPDLFPAARQLDPDLFLAGHTHGGQVCLPGGHALITHDRIPRRFCKGIHRIGDAWFIVSSGIGFSGPPVRLFCPAEAVELTLVRHV